MDREIMNDEMGPDQPVQPYKPPPNLTFFERFSFKSLTFKITMVEIIVFLLTIIHTVYLQKYVKGEDDKEGQELYSFECVLYAWGSKHTPSILYHHHYLRLITPALLHGSFSHIIGNMVVQVYYGFMLEISYGWQRVSIVYVIGAIGASLFSCVRFYYETSVGASGAIFALLALELVYFIVNFPAIEFKRVVVFVLVGPMIFLSFIDSAPQVDIAGHLGGLVVGLIIGFAYTCADHRNKHVQLLQYVLYLLLAVVFIGCWIIIVELGGEDRKICEGMNII